MNTNSQEEMLMELLRQVALKPESSASVVNAAGTAGGSPAEVLATVTKAVAEGTAAAASTGASSIEGIAGKVLSSVFGSGFGLAPLIGGLWKLFGGGGDEAPPPVVKYTAPDPIDFPLGFSRVEGGATSMVDYARGGIPRLVATASTEANMGGATPNQDSQQAWTAQDAPPLAAAPQVTIQVQAMDSRSFLDHSDDIANAVREALLRTHSLNDVIAEL